VVLLQTAQTYAHATIGEMEPVKLLFDTEVEDHNTNSLKIYKTWIKNTEEGSSEFECI